MKSESGFSLAIASQPFWLLKAKAVDINPVYGVYYSSSGERVDEGTAEAVDENNYYGQ